MKKKAVKKSNKPTSAKNSSSNNHVRNNPNNRNPVRNNNNQTRQNSNDPVRSSKPQSRNIEKTHKEMSKAMNNKTRVRRKPGSRGRNYSFYYLFAVIVVVVVLVVLANTVLFRCTEIEVAGNVRYTPEQIIAGSELKTGDNLLHINAKDAAAKVVEKCLFIDEAEVKKSFPTKLVITVKESQICFSVSDNGTTAGISRGGRVIKYLDGTEDAIVLKGFEPESLELGAWLKSKNDTKNELPWEMLTIMEEAGLTKITEIDVSDRYSPKVTIDNRILLNLGGATELESKFLVAKDLIELHIREDENVIVSLSNPEKPSVRPNNSASQIPETPENPETTPEETTSEPESSQGG